MNTQHGDVHGRADGMMAVAPLAEPIFWIALALCIVAQIAILRSAFARRGGSVAAVPGDSVGVIPHSPRSAEMVWAVIPAIGLGFLFAAIWRAIH